MYKRVQVCGVLLCKILETFLSLFSEKYEVKLPFYSVLTVVI